MPGMLQPERKLTWDVTGTLCRVEVKSLFTGRNNVMTLGFTREQFNRWQGGEYIQRAMPQLSDDEREFLMSGATPQEWAEEFSDND